MLENITTGLGLLFSWDSFLGLVLGTVGGMIVGALPGFSATMGVALLLPMTFGMNSIAAMVMLTAMYTSAVYGGSITAIMCHTPGTAASAATAIDGYELTKKGRGLEAVGVSTLASMIGGVVGALALLFIAPPLGRFSLRFAALEYFLVAAFGITIIGTLAGDNMAKGLASGVLGLWLGCWGCDALTGVPRFTFGILALEDGISTVPAMIGLFSVSQVMMLAYDARKGRKNILDDPSKEMVGRVLPPWKELKPCMPHIARSSILGTIIGIVPAAGGGIASWTGYSVGRSTTKHPEEYGNGSFEGVAASEAGNNAAAGGALIPMFTLGIPGSSVAAVLLGGLMIHGIVPGASLFTSNGPMMYAIFLGYLAANVLMAALGFALSKPVAKLTVLPIAIMAPIIVTLCSIGSFAIRKSFFDVILMAAFGLLGFFMRKGGFATAPMVLGLILSDHLESYFRRALILARGDIWGYFLTRPIAIVLAILIVLSLALPFITKAMKKRKAAKAAASQGG